MWGLIRAISPSSFSKQSAYAAVDLHRLGRYTPLIIKTTNGGASWQTIINGLPFDEHVSVVRADPVKQGLLYAGTNRGVYISFDDGGKWQPLSQNLPSACITDMLVHQGDLIISTQGRGIWILDNLSPLRELSTSTTAKPAHLFEPLPALRVRGNLNQDTPPPPSTPLGQNPPSGATIDYWLKESAKGPVVMTIRDSAGNIVHKFTSDQVQEQLSAKRYFEEGWLGTEKKLSTAAGMHRFVWDLRYPRPEALSYGYTIAGVWQVGTVAEPEGPLVLPGLYTVTLTVDGTDYSQPLTVKQDPRVQVGTPELRDQMKLWQAITVALSEAVVAHGSVSAALDSLKRTDDTKALVGSLSALKDKDAPSLSSVAGVLSGLASTVQNFDGAPTRGQRAVFSEHRQMLDALLVRWKNLKDVLSRMK